MRYIPALVLFGLCAVFVVALSTSRQESTTSALRDLPVATLSTLTGEVFESTSITGPAIINIFASWCAPCIAEFGILSDIQKAHPLPHYGIAWKDSAQKINALSKKYPLPYNTVLLDDTSRFFVGVGASGVPETLVINREGKIMYHFKGPLTESEVRTRLMPLLETLK